MNTLNNIHALVDIDTGKAKSTIVELSKLMRYVLYEASNKTILLKREVQFLENYIAIMGLRYTDKVSIEMKFPIEVPEVQIPPLLFISFVENAFKHGVSYRNDSFVRVIVQQEEGNRLTFRCTNSNNGRADEQHHGIGLDNIRKRLRLLFGNDYTLSITQDKNKFDVSDYISRVPFLSLVKPCQDAFEAMKVLSDEDVDLIFVDINMPDLNGLDFIRSLISPPLVIFTTAYSEYAVDGFKLDAVDYLLKPFEFQDLLKAADKARKQFEYKLLEQQSELGNASQVKGDSLFVKSDCRVVRIDINNIRYIEGMSEYVRIFVEGENKPVITLASLQKMEERLPAHFMRVHRSYIVNLRKITEISRLRIIFDKNTYIPVGDNYKERFTEFISKLSFS